MAGKIFSNLMMAVLLVLFLTAALGCETLSKILPGNPTPSQAACFVGWEESLALACPMLSGISWEAQEICEHSANAAHETKIAACIGAGVITEPID